MKTGNLSTTAKISTLFALFLTFLMISPLFSTTAAVATSFQNVSLSTRSSDSSSSQGDDKIKTVIGNNSKVVILGFSDNTKSQFVNAKPILDKYGFKATFFIICNKVGQDEEKMTWEDIAVLQNEGHDIQSHSMNHLWMDSLSASELEYEIGESKKCLAEHGINSTIFETPHGSEWDNATVINMIAKYYEFARQGYHRFMFLKCDGYTHYSDQKDCRTYFDNGTLTFANKYSIRGWSHNGLDKKFSYDDEEILKEFIERVEAPSKYNTNGNLSVITIIDYHRIDNERLDTSTDVDLFAEEMEYLYENGFTVLPFSSLKYNSTGHYFYLDVDVEKPAAEPPTSR
ncbi:MAG TPA: polysaccharide deacetylase family protein [Nitrososphaera sp.]|nr:polysaccharide deacetylase family protein [Nitrososphaera sp.]